MRLAVFSDIHDHRENLAWLQTQLARHAHDARLCCGDMVSLDTLKALEDPSRPLFFCLGNMDEGRRDEFLGTPASAMRASGFHRSGQLMLGGKKVAFTHYPDLALQLARSSEYAAVFYGHTHRRHAERVTADDGTVLLLANPGDIQNRHGDGPSFLIWDSESGEVEFVTA